MKLGIMQPYFLPYIGYFQLINAVDKYILVDNIQYTKQSWFNRNRFLVNGHETTFTIPLKKNKHRVDVNQRFLADNSHKEKIRILKQIQSCYSKAPFFSQNYPLIRSCILCEKENLFEFIYYSILEICSALKINTEIIVSSELDVNHDLKAQDRVIEYCKYFNTDIYINSYGGRDLYDKDTFKKSEIELIFLTPKYFEYEQFSNEFIPWLSIIDVLMFNHLDKTKDYLNLFELS